VMRRAFATRVCAGCKRLRNVLIGRKGSLGLRAEVGKGMAGRANLFGQGRRVRGLKHEPEAMSRRMKDDGRWVSHDESGGCDV
jgi:hypothetical protein